MSERSLYLVQQDHLESQLPNLCCDYDEFCIQINFVMVNK